MQKKKKKCIAVIPDVISVDLYLLLYLLFIMVA